MKLIGPNEQEVEEDQDMTEDPDRGQGLEY